MEGDILKGITRPCTIMSVFPHPDDESFASGGTMARYFRDPRVRCVSLSLTKGGASRALLKVGLPETRETVIREREFQTAAAILGLDAALIWGYPDGGLAEVPETELKEKIKSALLAQKADVVLTYGPDGITGHPDHLTCSRLTAEAAGEAGVERLYFVSAPPWIARSVLRIQVQPPTHAVDIREVYPVKILALKAHASQMLISRQPMIWVGVIMRMFGKEFFHRVF